MTRPPTGTIACGLLLWLASLASSGQAAALRLDGFADAQGAISIQHKGDTVDPYFTLQALLMARENGLDTSAYDRPWADWLVTRQKPDATFDRFCRNGPVWAACKTADADDALLALWMKFLDTMPSVLQTQPAWQRSHQRSGKALAALLDAKRGVYLVSPVYQHGLFMDNLEVLSYQPARPGGTPMPTQARLAQDIHKVFWDTQRSRFLVSTQPEQQTVAHTFYPEQVAQIFPLLFDFKLVTLNRAAHYKKWMREHRRDWLLQSKTDFSWGLIAVIALQQGDKLTASCWLRETASAQRTSHWIVTDEVALQILSARGVVAALPGVACL